MSPTDQTSAPRRACCYLRSSKDRHDLSLDAQRRALQAYAHDQGVTVVAESAPPCASSSMPFIPMAPSLGISDHLGGVAEMVTKH